MLKRNKWKSGLSLWDVVFLRGSSGDWDLKQKVWFTVLLLFVYRVGVSVPLPFVDSQIFAASVYDSTAGSALMAAMMMVGSSLADMGVFALGVMPYITASIMFQLFKVMTAPAGVGRSKPHRIGVLQALADRAAGFHEMYDTDTGRKRISQWTRYLAVVLAAIQGFGVLAGSRNLLGVDVFTSDSVVAFVFAWFAMVVGSVIVMRLGEEITLKGFSNGTSLIIFTSILAGMPGLLIQAWVAKTYVGVIGFPVTIALVLALVVFVEKSAYNILVVYPKSSLRQQVASNKLPIKVAIAGVLPVIFASSLMSIPMMLGAFFDWQWAVRLDERIAFGSVEYSLIFVVLTVLMTFFSVPMVFDIGQTVRNLNTSGGLIPGYRPGGETRSFIQFIVNRMAGLDAVYLVAISLVTLFLFPVVGLAGGAFGATSIIIMCTVSVTALDAAAAESKAKGSTRSGFLVSTPK